MPLDSCSRSPASAAVKHLVQRPPLQCSAVEIAGQSITGRKQQKKEAGRLTALAAERRSRLHELM